MKKKENVGIDTDGDSAILKDDEVQNAEQTAEDVQVVVAPEDDETTEDASDDLQNEVIVSIGEEQSSAEEEHAKAPAWVRELRKSHRELQRKNRELEEKLKTSVAETKPAVTLGAKPELQDYDYDADKYDLALEKWIDQKRQVNEQKLKDEAESRASSDAWNATLASYGKAKTELKVRDFEDSEATVQETFSITQQGIILQGAENPALLIYALGKNPKKAKELASITDPVKYAFAVAKLETQLKVTNRNSAPPPERTIQGTGRVSGSIDSTLERLRSDAAKTGDYTKVTQYKMQKRT